MLTNITEMKKDTLFEASYYPLFVTDLAPIVFGLAAGYTKNVKCDGHADEMNKNRFSVWRIRVSIPAPPAC